MRSVGIRARWLAQLTLRPLHLCIPGLFSVFVSSFNNMFLARHFSEFLRENKMV
jgi:hypothetical protein